MKVRILIEQRPGSAAFLKDNEDMPRLAHARSLCRARQIGREIVAVFLRMAGGKPCIVANLRLIDEGRCCACLHALVQCTHAVHGLCIVQHTFIEKIIVRNAGAFPVNAMSKGKGAAEAHEQENSRKDDEEYRGKEQRTARKKSRQGQRPETEQAPQKQEADDRQGNRNGHAPDEPIILYHHHEDGTELFIRSGHDLLRIVRRMKLIIKRESCDEKNVEYKAGQRAPDQTEGAGCAGKARNEQCRNRREKEGDQRRAAGGL